MPNRPIIQYDENKQYIKRFPSQKEASSETGISEYRMLQSRKNNIPVDGFYFFFESPLESWYIEKTCEYCGKTFQCERQRLKNKHLFCSRECSANYKKSQSKKYPCVICGKLVHRKPSQVNTTKNITCSEKCKGILSSLTMQGENNHQFGLKGAKNSSWISDERISYYGYKLIRKLDHPFKNSDGFVFEHRLVAEEYLLNEQNKINIDGKDYLSPDYHVHHIDFDRTNNDVDNLYVLPNSLHVKFHNSLDNIIRENGKIKTIEKPNYTKQELRELFYSFIESHKDTLSDTERGDKGFGDSGRF